MNGCPESISDKGFCGHLVRTLIDLNRSMNALACRQQFRCSMSVCSFCSPDYAASPLRREAVQFVCV